MDYSRRRIDFLVGRGFADRGAEFRVSVCWQVFGWDWVSGYFHLEWIDCSGEGIQELEVLIQFVVSVFWS
jgi:hypothetical protein